MFLVLHKLTNVGIIGKERETTGWRQSRLAREILIQDLKEYFVQKNPCSGFLELF